MAKEIYNEGRVVGLSAYELYLRHHKSSLGNDTPPADEAAWLASSLGGGASLVLEVNPDRTPGDYVVPLPDNSTLCGASTITCSLFDGDADFDTQGWATRITSYGQLIKFTNEIHPEKDSNVVPDGDPWTKLDRQKMVDYLSITDGLVYQPGNWEAEESQSETGPSAYDWSKESYMLTNPTTSACADTYKNHIEDGFYVREINREIIIHKDRPSILMSLQDANMGEVTLNGQSCEYRLEGAALFVMVESIKLKYNELVVTDTSGERKTVVYIYNQKGERQTSINYVPNLNKTGYIKLRIDKELRQPIHLLLTGWLDKTILSSITKKDEGHVNYKNPQNGDFLGPEAYPWACKIVFTISSNILDAISSKKYSRRIDTNGGDATSVPAQPIIDFNHDDFEYYYNNNKYIGPRLTTHSYDIEELNVEGGSGAAITTISPNREEYIYPPAIYGSKLDEKSKSATLYPLDVAAPGTVKAFNDKNYALKYTSAVRGGYGIYVDEADNDANMTLFDTNGNIHDIPSNLVLETKKDVDNNYYYAAVKSNNKNIKTISLQNDKGEPFNTYGDGGTTEAEDLNWTTLLNALTYNKTIDILGDVLKLLKRESYIIDKHIRTGASIEFNKSTSSITHTLTIDTENQDITATGDISATGNIKVHGADIRSERFESIGDLPGLHVNCHTSNKWMKFDSPLSCLDHIRIMSYGNLSGGSNGPGNTTGSFRCLFIQQHAPSDDSYNTFFHAAHKDNPDDAEGKTIPVGSVWIQV